MMKKINGCEPMEEGKAYHGKSPTKNKRRVEGRKEGRNLRKAATSFIFYVGNRTEIS